MRVPDFSESKVGCRRSWPSRSLAPLLLALSAYLLPANLLFAQSSESTSQSWTNTSQLNREGANPTRTVESHSQSGNRTVDNQSIQQRSSYGDYVPYSDIEKETIKVGANTVRTITRTFGDADGTKTLVQVSEEEKHTTPAGNTYITRSTSNPDGNGNLQLVQREIEETKKISQNVEETKTTVMLPGVEGGLTPAMMTEERRTQNSNDSVQSQKTTLRPDGNGGWQVSEVKETKTQQQGGDRTTEQRVSRPDADGHLSEVSRTISKETISKESTAPGEKHSTTEDYSINVPGTAQDGSLHLVERATTVQSTGSTGQQSTQEQVETINPADPGAGVRVSVVTTDSVRPGASGATATETIQMLDANGSMAIISVDTSKSTNVQAVQVQIAPEKAK